MSLYQKIAKHRSAVFWADCEIMTERQNEYEVLDTLKKHDELKKLETRLKLDCFCRKHQEILLLLHFKK